jgi:hypothetical protein
MLRFAISLALSAAFGALWSDSAFAYIGPGAGITVLGALWGVIVAIVLTVVAVVLWPFRVLLRRRRKGVVKSQGVANAVTGQAKADEASRSDTNSSGNPE